MKTLNNLGWMLLGVAVGSGALYCYNECSCNGGIKKTINKVKKTAEDKIENMMGK
mgnify:CR=1 FL=1